MNSHPRTLFTIMVIYLTRHGLSEHNLRTQVYMGRSPASRLVEEGREQALLLGDRLAGMNPVGKIICSSLPRTTETARHIASRLGIGDVTPEDAFWELSKGEWEGTMPRENLPPAIQKELDSDPYGFQYPGGESYRLVRERAGPAFDRWVQSFPGETLLFVLHGDVIRALLHHLLQFPPAKIGDFVVHPCSLTEFWYLQGRYHLVRFNDDNHLR